MMVQVSVLVVLVSVLLVLVSMLLVQVSMLLVLLSVLLELVCGAGFLGVTSFYKNFFKGYASTATSMTQLLKKDCFCLNSSATTTFKALKLALT
jgi:uncharacterized membrane protein